MTDRLTQKQTAAMFALMAVGREVSNPELRELAGFALDGEDRRRLNDKLVNSHRKGRSFVHELSDDGWAWCEEELTAGSPPPPRGSLNAALYLLLDGFGSYLRRENLRLATVLAPAVTTAPAAPTGEIESRIRVAYRKLARSPGDWAALADLRPMLDGASRSDVDAVLRELSRTRQVLLTPEANRKALTEADHEAALRIGNEDNHLIAIEES